MTGRLTESHGPVARLYLRGLAVSAAGLFGIVWELVRGNALGWASTQSLVALGAGAVLLGAFVAFAIPTRRAAKKPQEVVTESVPELVAA